MKFLFILVLLTTNITAKSSEDTDSHEENSKHHAYNNHIALFLGSTSYYNKSKSYFSMMKIISFNFLEI